MVFRILSVSFQAAVAVFVLVALTVVILVSGLPRATGAQALIVLSGSMEPTIPVGAVVIARPVDPADVRVRDVITFTHDSPAETVEFDPSTSTLVTHRVIAIEETGDGTLFHTRGDANTVPDDPPVRAADVRGRVWYHVPYFGYAQQAMTRGPTLLYAAAGLLLVFGIWLLGIALSGDGEKQPGSGAEKTRPDSARSAASDEEDPR